jgi:hypothetical protein
MLRSHGLLSTFVAFGMLLAGITAAAAQQYDGAPDGSQPTDADAAPAPGRVTRLAYLDGQVQFAPAGEDDWGSVDVNRPLVTGDRLLTGADGRAVLELGGGSIRIDHDSAFNFLNLDQDNVQLELSQGTLNLAVRQLDQGENFEVDTPTVAFVAATPGVYRIDDSPTGTGTMVTVFQGSATVYGENGVSREVTAGTSYRFNDSALASVDVTGIPDPDDFDRFCEAHDAEHQRYAQQEQPYVPPDMIGGDQLDQYGQWNDVPEYGNVWYPSSVPVGWAPYRYGHWAWIDPWGWTWVDDQPWGFAPFHYGRWVYARNRWGWMPGPVGVRPVYAPALVAFVGGAGLSMSLRTGGGPVGWFPLGPRDVYTPWFHASRRYFTQVNVTNIRNVYVNHTVINNFYNDYHAGRRPPLGRGQYAYRRMPGAVTAVPRDVFAGARPIHPAALRLDRNRLARTQIATRPDITPDRASLGMRRASARPAIRPDRQAFTRPVVARRQPPPRPVPFAAREAMIARQHGQPLNARQMQGLQRSRPTAQVASANRVRLVPAVTRPMPQRAPSARPQTNTRPGLPARTADRAATGGALQRQPFRNTARPSATPDRRFGSERPGALPSARFAPRRDHAPLPRVTTIRPANDAPHAAPDRLPAVRPVERAPQSTTYRAGPSIQRQDFQAEQRVRQDNQRAAQQRQVEMQRERAQATRAPQPRWQPPRSAPARAAPRPQLYQQRPAPAIRPQQQSFQRAQPAYQRPAERAPPPREYHAPAPRTQAASERRADREHGQHER